MEFEKFMASIKLKLEETNFNITDDELSDLIEDLFHEGLSVDEATADILFENLV